MEQSILPINSIELLIRLGNSEESIIEPLIEKRSPSNYEILNNLKSRGLLREISSYRHSDYVVYDTMFTERGLKVYEKAKEIAETLMNSPETVIIRLKRNNLYLDSSQYELIAGGDDD